MLADALQADIDSLVLFRRELYAASGAART